MLQQVACSEVHMWTFKYNEPLLFPPIFTAYFHWICDVWGVTVTGRCCDHRVQLQRQQFRRAFHWGQVNLLRSRDACACEHWNISNDVQFINFVVAHALAASPFLGQLLRILCTGQRPYIYTDFASIFFFAHSIILFTATTLPVLHLPTILYSREPELSREQR